MMRIERMAVKDIEAPLRTPFRIATGQHDTLKDLKANNTYTMIFSLYDDPLAGNKIMLMSWEA